MHAYGITRYGSAHLEHAFTFLTYDLLQRRLEDLGACVRMVRNVADVDEPIYVKTKQLGAHCLDLARTESAEFAPVMQALNSQRS
ncbi:cysteinyl-tRNA synthetase, MshC [Streptomyces malaysiensis]|uniref:Cysteinyl-tRNA synthetase, MshC n=2 Tax=Streptomyces malaysiensis TaxID=92644 RepID=A0A7X5X2L8_STRMQ|nr:cysteinyl-tRNA synthetase, MshC [Streptomyces malaysiensis]